MYGRMNQFDGSGLSLSDLCSLLARQVTFKVSWLTGGNDARRLRPIAWGLKEGLKYGVVGVHAGKTFFTRVRVTLRPR